MTAAHGPYDRALFWFRRDLRDHDNAGLHYALRAARQVWCVFVFDREILDALPARADRRVEFILGSVRELAQSLEAHGGGLIVRHARADAEIPRLAVALGAQGVFVNDDYEPDAVARDRRVEAALAAHGVTLHRCKDTVIFEKDEILTQSGTPFSVFTPYKNAWLKRVSAEGDFFVRPYPIERHVGGLAKPAAPNPLPTLAGLGFEQTNLAALGIAPGMAGAQALLHDFRARMAGYRDARDYPAVKGVSYLSVHNRFGTVSIRELAALALHGRGTGAATWLSELVWRDFYFQILHHHPHVVRGAFRSEYDRIAWPGGPEMFAAWCEARTGYPIVDAAMRQINATGYMHNRLRMIAASFLTKDLHVDWRMGERYFADHLNDYDLAANNGGWQWAASTGCDAQPYFRIFNPVTQSEKFDAEGKFIRRYVPELAKVPDKFIHAPWTMPAAMQQAAGVLIGRDYPAPVVDHGAARTTTLALFAAARQQGGNGTPIPP